MKLANICPVCRRKLTKGVEQRVEELAGRPDGFQLDNAIGFMRLRARIATVLGSDSPSVQKVWNFYNALIAKFGDEYTVLIDASKEELSSIAGEAIVETVVRVREWKAEVVPGYDGVYGQLVVSKECFQAKALPRRVQQLNLTDFTL